jgi:hypothetical protein
MSTEIKRVTRSMTRSATQDQQVSTQSLYIYKDPKTGIEFLTKEQCEMRGISEEMINLSYGLYYIKKITSINDSYVRHLSDDIRLSRTLYALPPSGFLWKEGPSTTSYYSWDEPYVLVKNPYI